MSSNFIWYELLTSDPDAAAAFYCEVIGWSSSDSGLPDRDYRILNMDGVAVGGLMALPPGAAEAGMRPGWLGYVGVADVDQSVAGIVAAGGVERMPAMDMPGVGRMAMVADPQGVNLYVMTLADNVPSSSFAPGKPGHGGWHELRTQDWEEALDFYTAQFGWGKVDAMDMGEMGTYLMFNFGSGDMVGGMFNDPEAAHAYWLFYFNVADIEAAGKRVMTHGGTAMTDPHQVPTGDWIIQACDPQGAAFALVGPKL